MKRYISIYASFFRFSFHNFLAFRARAINGMISTLGWGTFQFIWIQLLTIRTKSAFGWTKDELVILAILYIIIIGFFHLLFSPNFDRLTRTIDRGELDFLLLKPLDPQFSATCAHVNFPNLFRIVLGTIFLVIYITTHAIPVSLGAGIGFITFVIFGIALLYSLWLAYCTLLIWFPRLTNIIEFLYTINGMGRYPTEMIRSMGNILAFFLIPFSLAIATPTRILLHGTLKGDSLELFLVSVSCFFLSRAFFLYSLRHYSSASS